jgi:hypothetical protein
MSLYPAKLVEAISRFGLAIALSSDLVGRADRGGGVSASKIISGAAIFQWDNLTGTTAPLQY